MSMITRIFSIILRMLSPWDIRTISAFSKTKKTLHFIRDQSQTWSPGKPILPGAPENPVGPGGPLSPISPGNPLSPRTPRTEGPWKNSPGSPLDPAKPGKPDPCNMD